MPEDGPYSAAGRRYRTWSRVYWIVFLTYLPALAYASQYFGWTRGNGAPIFVAIAVWMIAFAIVGYQKSNFACPRCGKPFFRRFDDRPWRRSWVHNPFARRCMHCGLPKWSGRDPAPHDVH